MEGNPHLVRRDLAIEKPIVIRGTQRFKRTFPFDSGTGQLRINGACSADEVALEQSMALYASTRLLRGLWKEGGGESSGTFFALAAPSDGRVILWGGAGHCMMPEAQTNWRCGHGTEVLPSAPSCAPAARNIVSLDWLTRPLDPRELAEVCPSDPSVCIKEADVMPDFRFMLTTDAAVCEAGKAVRLFIPCAKAPTAGDAVCVLGFADKPAPEWSRILLRTEADYQQEVQDRALRGAGDPPPDWRLDPNVAFQRAIDLLEDVCFPSRLVAAPGVVAAASERIVEHTCSTFQGMSGSPGVDVRQPWKLLFVHTRADEHWRRNNYGYSVNHPLFFRAYVREVLPRVLDTPPEMVTREMAECLRDYVCANARKLVGNIEEGVDEVVIRIAKRFGLE